MKKTISIILLLVMCLALFSACGREKEVTVVIDGKSQTVTRSEICGYPAKYKGADITVTDKVQRIDGPYLITSSHHYEYWLNLNDYKIKVDADDPIMESLDVGDTITAKGKIEDAAVVVYVCGWGDHEGYNSRYTDVKIAK